MTQRFEPTRSSREPRGAEIDLEDGVRADRAERILRRAIELQSATRLMEPIDREKLIRMARELDIDADYVLRALAEHQSGLDTDESRDDIWRRLLAPDRVVDGRVVRGSSTAVEESVESWFRTHEGMRPRRHLEDGILWERDSHPLTSIRMGLRLGQGTGALRNNRGVTHRVREVKPGEQLVSIEANTAGIRRTGQTLLTVGAVAAAGAVGIGSVAFGGPLEPGTIGLALSTLTAFTASTIFGVRAAVKRLTRGIARALDAMADSLRTRRR